MKSICVILILLVPSLSFGQFKESKDYKLEGSNMFDDFTGHQTTAHFVVGEHLYSARMRSNLLCLERFNAENLVLEEQKIVEVPKEYSFEFSIVTENELKLILSKKDTSLYITTAKLDDLTINMDFNSLGRCTTTSELNSHNSLFGRAYLDLHHSVLANGDILVYHYYHRSYNDGPFADPYQPKNKLTLRAILIDGSTLKLKFNKTMDLSDEQITVVNSVVSEDGELFFGVMEYFDNSAKAAIDGRINFKWRIIRVDNELNSTNTFDLQTEYGSLASLDLFTLAGRRILVGGGIASSGGAFSRSSFNGPTDGITLFELKGQEFEVLKTIRYPKEIIEAFNPPDDYPQSEMQGLQVKRLFLTEKNEIIFLSASIYSSASAPYFRDIVVGKLSSDGTVNWINKLPVLTTHSIEQYISFLGEKNFFVTLIDDVGNANLKINESAHGRHLTAYGDVVSYKIDLGSGEVEKMNMFYTNDFNGAQIFDVVSGWSFRFFHHEGNKLTAECHANRKQDMVIRINLFE